MKLPPAFYRIENLKRAWRWIRSNPDAGYKSYFREQYAAYAAAQDSLLPDLADRLRRGAYSPAPASKIYLPKPSGILRPYSLLEIEDQIILQAATNIIAEQMFPRVRYHYMERVFGHLYAGKSRIWFYRKWSHGYAAFNKAATDAYESGKVFAASFDLTAFYDSIDHRVLSHFLQRFGVDRDLVCALCEWLSAWTGTEAKILLGHGIPQGPMSSGLIAEAVLSHLDNHRWSNSGVVYLRYVDDIRLFAKTEFLLRQALIRLDLLSKDIGLFPQSSKISIHRVTNIGAELKSVSQPPEAVIKSRQAEKIKIDQKRVFRRLVELSHHYRIDDKTRFKYVLANALPSAALTSRLWRILDNSPELYESVACYLMRSTRLPRRASREVIRRIKVERLYPSVSAAFLRAIVGTLHPSERRNARTEFKKMWAPKSRRPDFTVALGQWLLSESALTDRQIAYACARSSSSWVRSSLLLAVDANVQNPTVRNTVANVAMTDLAVDPAIAGALISGKDGVKPRVGARHIRRQAALVLKEFGLIRRATGRTCGINSSLSALLEQEVVLNWRSFFGTTYRQAERQIVGCRGYASTDATAWVQGLDVFNDLVLDALFRKDPTMGRYKLGNIGSCTGSPPAALSTNFPRVLDLASKVHNLRYQSFLAHPRVKKTMQATGQIRFRFIRESKHLIANAVREIERSGLV